jgi:RNA polymerase sigma factor (sigma-70 family)
MSASGGAELLAQHEAVIGRAIAFVCRRYRFDAHTADDFRGTVWLKLIENDYAVLRAFGHRSSFATYISTVIQRLALDYRTHEWGKWRPSAAARHGGDLAVDLEQLVVRDGRTLDDALQILSARHGSSVTRARLDSILAELPRRDPRRVEVDVDAIDPATIAKPPNAEETLMDGERRRTSARVAEIMSSLIAKLPEDDRVLIQLHFENGMTVAQIARALQIDQKLAYRRIEKHTREMRRELLREGISARDALDLVGRDEELVHFPFGKTKTGPSIPVDDTATAPTEASR